MLNTYIPSFSKIQESFSKNFTPSNIAAGLSGITAVKIADFLRSAISYKLIPGFICGSNSTGDAVCRYGSVGEMAIPLCVERINSIQPLKPIFTFLGTTVNCISSFPSYLLGLTEKSLLNIAFNATGEELFCRGLIQRVLIRNAQEKILKRLSPNYGNLVDHSLVKATRIIAASIIFGLLHTRVWECRFGGTIPEIAGGIIFGVLAESRYGLTSSALAHTIANLITG
jgi:hypothetical protein